MGIKAITRSQINCLILHTYFLISLSVLISLILGASLPVGQWFWLTLIIFIVSLMLAQSIVGINPLRSGDGSSSPQCYR